MVTLTKKKTKGSRVSAVTTIFFKENIETAYTEVNIPEGNYNKYYIYRL